MTLEPDLESRVESADDLPPADEVYDRDDEIPMDDLFDAEFMATYTQFESFDEMVAASPSDAASAEELGLVPDGEWDEFVAEHTSFDDEAEMVFAARDHWVAKRLDL